MSLYIGIVIGLIIGAPIGMVIMALCAMVSDKGPREEEDGQL